MPTSSPTHPARRPRPHLRRSPKLLALLVLAAVLGGAVTLVLALAIGALQTTSRTTTVIERVPTSVSASGSGDEWRALYPHAAAATVDITAQISSTVETPLGTAQRQGTATGSGFVLDGRGEIVTAAHVIDGASSITVAFQGGAARRATVLGSDDSSDVAVLRVDPTGLRLHPLELGSSRALAIGERLAVIGSPLGFERSLSTGVVSGLDRTVQAPSGFTIAHAIQTDAAMNPGNSGGPILDRQGRVLGIAEQIATGSSQSAGATSETSTGVGFAVPIDLIRAELPALARGQRVTHAYLGVGTADALAGGRQAALVETVPTGPPAASAGIRPGDLIVAFNGKAIGSSSELIHELATARPGERIRLTVLRDASRITVSVTLGTQPTRPPSQ